MVPAGHFQQLPAAGLCTVYRGLETGSHADLRSVKVALRAPTLRANAFALDLIDASARSFPSGGDGSPPGEEVRTARDPIAAQLLRHRDAFVTTHQDEFLTALS